MSHFDHYSTCNYLFTNFEILSMRILITLALFISSIFLSAQDDVKESLSKYGVKAEIESNEKLGESNFYKVGTDDYRQFIFDSVEKRILDKGIDAGQALIVTDADHWKVFYQENNMGETSWELKGQLQKSTYDSISLIGLSSIIGYNSEGLFGINIDDLSSVKKIEGARAIFGRPSDEVGNWSPSWMPYEFDFGKVFIKFKSDAQYPFYDNLIDVSNAYGIVDTDDWSLATSDIFEDILTPTTFSGYSVVKMNGELVVYNFDEYRTIDSGFKEYYFGGYDELLIVKPNSIATSIGEGWTEYPVSKVEKVKLEIIMDGTFISMITSDGIEYAIDTYDQKMETMEETLKRRLNEEEISQKEYDKELKNYEKRKQKYVNAKG